jgi:CDP-glucose 4,6-dehydratase
MEELVNPWKSRRVFLTGHTGFKGGWLALWLASHGAVIRGFALDPATEPSFFVAAKVKDVLEDVRGDIRDFEQLKAELQSFQPEVVFHLAAQPLVRESYADPVGTYATNVMGTAHVLEAVRNTSSPTVVICVTTDKVYRNREWEWAYREIDPLGGTDPYSSSKAAAELVVDAYRNSYFPTERFHDHGVAVATVRAGNVIGGGDWARDRLIPDLIRGFEEKKPVQIRNPKAVRPWQHVLDPLHGYILLAERMLRDPTKIDSAFNFGPAESDAWPVARIATKMAEIWGSGAAWAVDESAHPHEHQCLRLDASRAHAKLGWVPRLKIESALEWTVGWYRNCFLGADMAQFTNAQLRSFIELA